MAPTQLPTSEVLNLAADHVRGRGWTTGLYGWASSGPVCTEGAIFAAMGTSHAAISTHDFRETCPAYLAVMDYLDNAVPIEPTMGERVLWAWNDEYDYIRGQYARTEAEVLEVLRAVALVEAAREDAAMLAEVGR